MDFTSEFNKENFAELYSSNRDLFVPAISIFVSFILFIFFVFPQAISFPAKKAEADQESIKLNRIQASYDFVTRLDPKVLGSSLKVAQKTLPDKKDFESVLGAISVASGNTATQIKDYSFSEAGIISEKYPQISFNIEVFGGIEDALRFIDELYKTYPISNVVSLSNSESVSKIVVNFYYRAFPPVSLSDRISVSEVPEDQKNTLGIISGWNDSTFEFLDIPPEASASSSTPF